MQRWVLGQLWTIWLVIRYKDNVVHSQHAFDIQVYRVEDALMNLEVAELDPIDNGDMSGPPLSDDAGSLDGYTTLEEAL